MDQGMQTRLDNIRIGVVVTGSHCTIGEIIPQLKKMREARAELYAISHIPLIKPTTAFTR